MTRDKKAILIARHAHNDTGLIPLTRDGLWDLISGAFDHADSGDYEVDEQVPYYHDYYWAVTNHLFKSLTELTR